MEGYAPEIKTPTAMNTNQQTDPYAELKQAWEDGRRIRYTPEGGEPGKWFQRSTQPYALQWYDAPSRYEIEPLPADKSPDPTPAGKLTDEELGEIGAKAVVSHHGVFIIAVEPSEGSYHLDAKLRTTFARAVREAVEKEQSSNYIQIGTSRQADEIARLTAELKAANERIEAKQAGYVRCADQLEEANAELERLRWISRDILPARDDADANGYVNCLKRDGTTCMQKIGGDFHESITFWRPFCPPPAPSAEEVERERFDDSGESIAVASVLLSRNNGTQHIASHTMHWRKGITDPDKMRGIAFEEALKAKPGFEVGNIVVDIIPARAAKEGEK